MTDNKELTVGNTTVAREREGSYSHYWITIHPGNPERAEDVGLRLGIPNNTILRRCQYVLGGKLEMAGLLKPKGKSGWKQGEKPFMAKKHPVAKGLENITDPVIRAALCDPWGPRGVL